MIVQTGNPKDEAKAVSTPILKSRTSELSTNVSWRCVLIRDETINRSRIYSLLSQCLLDWEWRGLSTLPDCILTIDKDPQGLIMMSTNLVIPRVYTDIHCFQLDLDYSTLYYLSYQVYLNQYLFSSDPDPIYFMLFFITWLPRAFSSLYNKRIQKVMWWFKNR